LSDVRSGRVPRGSPIEYFAFITLFPKLIAGPIIRYTEILPQIREAAGHAGERIFTGLCIFSVGLFNKTVIADSLDPIVDPVYAAADQGLVPAGDAILATLAYATQILFDFSGYCTMAIGLAWMFGIRLPINFLSPYKATSVIEFWRRWHITLSRFLRDYLYIPLGGGRRERPDAMRT
jgi:alginate O-acetyltransferase complex protein AlgI